MSALAILKATFVRIHTEMEDQTRLYYQKKKQQRDVIFQNLVRELESKYRAYSERFLSKHANVVHLLNKPSLRVFNNRSLREERLTPTPSQMQQTRLDLDSEEVNKQLSKNFSMDQLNSNEPPPQEDKYKHTLADLDALKVETGKEKQQAKSLRLLHSQSAMRVRQGKDPFQNASRLTLEDTDKTYQGSVSKNASPTKARLQTTFQFWSPDKADRSQPYLGSLAALTSLSRNNLHEDHPENPVPSDTSIHKEPVVTSEKKRQNHTPIRLVKKPEATAIRITHKSPTIRPRLRESEQEVYMNEYFDKKEVHEEEVDMSNPENYKFIFEESKETRVKRILKDKKLKKGVFGMPKTLDYLKHEYEPSKTLWKKFTTTSNTFITNSSFENQLLHSQSFYPKTTVTDCDVNVSKSNSSSQLPSKIIRSKLSRILPTAAKSTASEEPETLHDSSENYSAQRPISTSIRYTSPKKLTGEPGSPQLTTPSPIVTVTDRKVDDLRRHAITPSRLDFSRKAKNTFYFNLKQKSAIQQKLNLRKYKPQDTSGITASTDTLALLVESGSDSKILNRD